MKVYELTVLFHPDLEMNLEPSLKKLESIVSDSGGKVLKITEDGKKRLAYKIKNQEYAIFYFVDVELPADGPQKIANAINISEEIMRHLLVVKDERREKMEEKRREAEANGEVEGEENTKADAEVDKDNKEE